MYEGDELHPPQPVIQGEAVGQEWAQVRAHQDELDAAIRQQKAAMKEKADFFAEVLASDPARFRAILGLQTDEDYAIQQAQVDALDKWRAAVIKRLGSQGEAHNG